MGKQFNPELIKFASLHNHNQYSYLDGLGTAEEWIQAAKDKGFYGLALTNHGNSADLLHFYEVYKKADYKGILGQEFYIESSDVVYAENKKELNRNYHLVVLAKNYEGYQNLIKLSSLAYEPSRFYYKPRITFEDLFQNHKGLICLTACVGGVLSKPFIEDKEDLAERINAQFLEVFKDDWYFEIQGKDTRAKYDKKKKEYYRLDYNPQEKANRKLIDLARKTGVKLVYTLDAHMINKDDKILQDIVIQTSQIQKKQEKWKFDEIHYLQRPEEAWEDVWKKHLYIDEKQFQEMCEQTIEVADKCKVEIKYDIQLPSISVNPLKDTIEIIQKNKRMDWNNSVYVERLKKEIDVIHKNGIIDLLNYFLILEDLVSWCKSQGIIVGSGRGSASGSLLCYLLGITEIDPIKYDLLFERFLSLARIREGSLPDIDSDIADRDAAIGYLQNKYGKEKVSSIGTVQELKIKQAFTDVCRIVFGEKEFDYQELKILSKYLPSTVPNANIVEIFKNIYEKAEVDEGACVGKVDKTGLKKFQEWLKTNEHGELIYKAVLNLLGAPRQSGLHASGVIISPFAIIERVPSAINKSVAVTQFTASWCEKAGFVKYDILGLSTLTDLQKCVSLIEKRRKVKIDLYSLEPNDENVLKEFAKGNTDTIFQFNTSLQKHLLKLINADNFTDIVVANAVGRPAALAAQMHVAYAEGKKNPQNITYIHPIIKEITEDCYGVMCYQEQIMQIFHRLGGLSLEDAEKVRKVMAKGKGNMDKYKEQFFQHAMNNIDPVMTEAEVVELWSNIEKYNKYLFNKSHAVSYTYISYLCMYLKYYYPLEWWFSVINNSSDSEFEEIFQNCPVKMLLPEINQSQSEFYINEENEIVIPISKIKGVGEVATKEIVDKRPYKNFTDFINKVSKRSVKKDVVLSLILSDCFKLIENRTKEEMIKAYCEHRDEEVPEELRNLDRMDLIKYKKNYLNFLKEDYISIFKDLYDSKILSLVDVKLNRVNGHPVIIGGIFKNKQYKVTKTGKDFCVILLSNAGESIPVYFWEEELLKFSSFINEGSIVQVKGIVNEWNGGKTVIAKDVKEII